MTEHPIDNTSYSKRNFGKQHPYLLPRAIDVIEKSIMAVAKNKIARNEDKDITIVDFGAGPGKYLKVYEQLADRLKDKGFILHYVAYDAFEKQLHDFEKEKLNVGQHSRQPPAMRGKRIYQKSGDSLPDTGEAPEEGVIGPTYICDNLTVQLIVGDKKNHPERIKELLPKETDVWLSLFAPLNHIRGRNTRIDILDIAKEISSGPVIVSGPCIKPDIPEVALTPGERSALEPGDMIYEPRGSKGGRNFLHIFTAKDLAEDFLSAGMPSVALQCNNIAEEHDLANNVLFSPPGTHWKQHLGGVQISDLPSSTQTHLKRLEDSEASRHLGLVELCGNIGHESHNQLINLQNSGALCLLATGLPPKAQAKGFTLGDFVVTEQLGKARS